MVYMCVFLQPKFYHKDNWKASFLRRARCKKSAKYKIVLINLHLALTPNVSLSSLTEEAGSSQVEQKGQKRVGAVSAVFPLTALNSFAVLAASAPTPSNPEQCLQQKDLLSEDKRLC